MDRRSIKGKRLLVLGGNTICKEMREYADRYGVTLITAGNDPHALSHRYSDEQYYFDVADKDLLQSFVKDKHIDGILSFTGEKLLGKTIQTVVDTGLPCHYTQKRWDTLMDKVRFKEAAKRHGISVLQPLTYEEAVSILLPSGRSGGGRVVVKPTRAGGSFGITVCDKADMLNTAIGTAQKWSTDGSYFIERFLEGDYFQFEIWCSGGKRYMAYTKDRVNYPAEPGCARQPYCDIYPSARDDIYKEAFFAPLCSLFDEIGLTDGSVQFQGIIENNVPYIMDVAYRVSGGMDFKVPCRDKGVDLVAGQMDYALTGEWIEDLSPLAEESNKCYLTLSPGIRNGRIARVEGIEEIKALPYVYDYFQYYEEGDECNNLGNFLQVFCRIFIEGTSSEDLFAKADEVMSLLKIKDESGQNMLLPSPLSEEKVAKSSSPRGGREGALVGMQQPYLFPYLGYWQMINAVDTFVIGDMSHMIQNGWVHQNRILLRYAAPFTFRLNLAHKQSAYMRPLCEVEIDHSQKNKWNTNFPRTLAENYCKAPFYEETMALILPLLENDEPNLSDYLYTQIKAVAGYLDMKTNIVRGKDVLTKEEYDLPVMEKIQLLRDRLGFDTWLSLSNGAHYYTKEMMAEIGIDIRFHQFDSTITYPQVGVRKGEPHIPYLSIIDVLMNCGKEGTKALLDKYTVV